jgi:hypothetical protein
LARRSARRLGVSATGAVEGDGIGEAEATDVGAEGVEAGWVPALARAMSLSTASARSELGGG